MSGASRLVVLGGGPGGYAAAFRAADLGLDVTLIEQRSTLGGVCLNEGCIPSKGLLHLAEAITENEHLAAAGISFSRAETDLDKLRTRQAELVGNLTGGLNALARRRKVKLVNAQGRIVSPGICQADGAEFPYDKLILATGSRPIQLDGWPASDRIWFSDTALELPFLPEHLIVVGGGIIGLEMATIYRGLGCEVTVIELSEKLLPMVDHAAASILQLDMQNKGIQFVFGDPISTVSTTDAKVIFKLKSGHSIEGDASICAVGRRANTGGLGLEQLGLKAEGGYLQVDDQCSAGVDSVFAVGDMTGGPMLAHRATHQGKIAAEVAAGHASKLVTNLIPSVAYTSPELAWIGLSKAEATRSGFEARETEFPWMASGRNLAIGGSEGLTKLVYDERTHRVLGATIVGKNAGELIAQVTLAIELCATLEDIALTVHAHPTLSETIAMAAERALGTLTDL